MHKLSCTCLVFSVELRAPILIPLNFTNGFVIEWNQGYNKEFISGHRVKFRQIGPRHFVPEGCVSESTYVFDLKNNISEFHFENALPGYEYFIEVCTVYTLGVTICANVTEVAPDAGELFERYKPLLTSVFKIS